MVMVKPFSVAFWVCYVSGGISDMIDGFIARKLNQQSAVGAKLDSIADLFFSIAILIVILKYVYFPIWVWLCIFIIGLIRIMSYSIGYFKYHSFSSLHSYLNKVTGTLIFTFPLLIVFFELNLALVIICFVAFVSSVEELVVTLSSSKLDPNRKSIFVK